MIRVVLPAFNEAANLGGLLDAIGRCLRETGDAFEIVVVDDGSHDGTGQVAEAHAKTLPLRVVRHATNLGLGPTIRDGLKVAAESSDATDVIVTMDADNSHDPALIPEMTRLIREGADVVVASRFQPGASVRGVPAHRVLLSQIASLVFRIVFPTRELRDFTCGYRVYRASLLQGAFRVYGDRFVDQKGFQCMADILLKLRAFAPVFREVPLDLRYDRKQGASKMRVVRTGWSTVVLICIRRLGV